MPSINMIAPRRAEKKRLEICVRRLILAILLETVLIVGVSGFMFTKIYSTKSEANAKQQRLKELTPKVQEIENCDKENLALMPKLDTLNDAKSNTLRWCRVMDRLSSSLPDKTWLTRVAAMPSTDSKSEEMAVNINGVSANQQLVGDTMLRMQSTITDFDKVDLHYTQRTMVGATPAVEFEVAAAIKLPKKDSKGEVQKS